MKVTRAQADENRRRIVNAAGALFKQNGFDGVAVADIMGEVGLTHGGFYGNFASKEDLAAETTATQLQGTFDRWQRLLEATPEAPLEALLASYFSPRNRDEPARGCPLTALATDVTRSGGKVQSAFTEKLGEIFDLVAAHAPGETEEQRRGEAAGLICGMVGALLLSRAVNDEGLREDLIAGTVQKLGC